MKGLAYVTPLPANLEEIKQRITTAFHIATHDMGGHVKGLVYVHPLPANPEELKQRITTALHTVTHDMTGYVKGLVYAPLFLQTQRNLSRESLRHCTLLPMTCCSVLERSWSTKLTCAVSQAERILIIP